MLKVYSTITIPIKRVKRLSKQNGVPFFMGFDHEKHDNLVIAILDAFPGSTITYSRTNRHKFINVKRNIQQYKEMRAYLNGRHRGEDDHSGKCIDRNLSEPSSAEPSDDNNNLNRRNGDRGGV